MESHRLETKDGEDIGAWFIDGRDDAPSVLVIHGHKGRRGNSLGRAELLASRGYAVLMITLRAHGDSTGEFDDVGFGARNDVIAGVDFLEARRPGRPVIVDGNSMGAAAAVFAARELGHRVRGYILESPYQDLRTAVWNRVEVALPPRAGPGRLRGPEPRRARLPAPHRRDLTPEGDRRHPRRCPRADPRRRRRPPGTPRGGPRLHEQVASHGRLVFFPGAGHGDLLAHRPELYRSTVLEFCAAVAGR